MDTPATDAHMSVEETGEESSLYALNMYFGVFYRADLHDRVREFLATSPTYAALSAGDKTLKLPGGDTISVSLNSDGDNETLGYIFVEDMTVGSEVESGEPLDLHFNYYPGTAERAEREHREAVLFMADLYTFLSRNVRTARIKKSGLYQGWRVMICAWDDSDEEDDKADTSATVGTTTH